ncbi:unnamed protein product, partial [Porites evermanni]
GNLKRHLKSHARKGHIENQQVDKTFLKTPMDKREKLKNCILTGLPFKWCPVDDCEVVTHLMRSHITRKHRLKPGPLLENYLRVVRSSPSPPTVHSTDSAMESQDIKEDITTEERDDEEESCPDDERMIDYPTASSPKDKMQTWLGLFYKYLNTPDCGRKRDKNRLQHATHVRTILEDIDPEGKDIEILSEDEGYIVWTEWVDRKLENKRSGTVRSHLGSYNHFLKFVTRG